jgi:NTE family protein
MAAGHHDADLVLEGGGVKGIGLVGAVSALEKAGYRFHRVAGTSAGAIVGALVAAGIPARKLHDIMAAVDYRRFRDGSFAVEHLGIPAQVATLVADKGIYDGNYLKEWLGAMLKDAGVETFGDLKITGDRDSALTGDRSYRLVVCAADVSRGELVRLPWDYRARYGRDPDRLKVVDAVRASMSIPLFYKPARIHSDVTRSDDLLVDGGLISDFPVELFDRDDGRTIRWPTFGVKLSARRNANQVAHPTSNDLQFVEALIDTMLNGHDQMHLDDPCVQARTIFVDTFDVLPVDFDIDRVTQRRLFQSGTDAATRFLATWDFAAYLRRCRTGVSAAAPAREARRGSARR